MVIAEKFIGHKASDIVITSKIAVGSLSPRFPREIAENRAAFRSLVTDSLRLPANVEEETVTGVLESVERRRLTELDIDYSKPYWLSGQRYKPLEVLNVLSQYLDFHTCSLPKTVLPPEKDVKEYKDRVSAEAEVSGHPLKVPQQLEIGLDIARNNIVGAANVLFIASRHMARSYEQRAYPGILITPEEILRWDKKIAQFEVYDKSGRIDGPGDTYYFWSHFYGALVYRALGDRTSRILQRVLSIGTPLMRNVRTHIARRPTETPHEEASILGRNLGLAVAEVVNVGRK